MLAGGDEDGEEGVVCAEELHGAAVEIGAPAGECGLADDDEGVIKERLFIDKDKPDILHNEMTTTDTSLTRPWTVMKNYRRTSDILWEENNCIEGQTWVTIGKEIYYLSGDGTIMPIKKDQPPPDLKYFNQPR